MTSAAASRRFGRFEIRPQQRQLLADGRSVSLGARAFDLLEALIDMHDRVVGHAELLELVWPGLVVDENNLRQHVSTLRKVLGPTAVVTVPGRGYRFGLALENVDASTANAQAAAESGSRERCAALDNLPQNLPSLIGRECDLASVVDLLGATHLLTLVGAGGIGKTRLALEVARTVAADYPDGMGWVELAPVSDPLLVAGTVANVLGVHEEPGRPLLDTLLDFLRPRRLLIILDNCEHLIESCARFTEQVLLRTAGVRILATSREPLNIAGETAWRLPSLRTAEPGTHLSPEALLEYAAIRLFVQRSMAASSAFELTPQNVLPVAMICHQLDGIPLALELAAARIGAMRVEHVAERLQDRFALLSRGSRTAMQRHQTLRSLIDWSHGLLSEDERALLRRLALFAGGWSLEAAEAICSDALVKRETILDVLTNLVEKSLVVLDGQSVEPRYRLLETIRQYALEKLGLAGEEDATRERHLLYFVDLADTIRPMLTRQEQLHWHERAETELDNFRVALNSARSPGNAEHGLHLFSSLTRFWYKNMHWKEMVGWQERLGECCRRDGSERSVYFARSLYGSAMLATNFDPSLGRRLSSDCLTLSRSLDFDEGIAWASMWIGYIDTRQHDAATAAMFDESLGRGRHIEDPWRRAFLLAQTLICYAGYEAQMGRDESAERKVAECETQIAKIGGDKLYVGHGRALLGTIAIRRGEFERADQLLQESLDLYRAVESRFDVAGSLAQQGFLALRRSDPQRALALFKESLPLHRNYPTSPWVTRGLAQLSIAFAAARHWTVAARLAGALSDASSKGASLPVAPLELSGRVRQAFEEGLACTRAALGEFEFDEAVVAGRRMTREEAMDFALDR